MAITLKTDYRKTLGLPGYSSHSFSASVEVEINNIEDAPREIQELYEALQQNVDHQIQNPGFVPPGTYGMDEPQQQPQAPAQLPYNGSQRPHQPANVQNINTAWKCSDKQRELILKLLGEKSLSKDYVEQLATERFGKGVRLLNKLEASSLIELLFDTPTMKKANSYQKGGRR